ncbi:MAG TPA: hypothetical protein VJT50_07655 [Pyrinomonadaceae bacterium]|nr:hypothetical protein [Pyrinomonadaceae bacterium]
MPSKAKSQATAKLARQAQTSLIQSVKLGDVFKAVPKPKYILGTTYTLSLAFFESIVFPCLERSALKSCLIVADSFGYGRALEEAPALQGAGQDYMVAPAPLPGCFHAKVWIVVGDTKTVILVGSGNLTQAGFMTNAEYFDAVHIPHDSPVPTEFVESVRSFVRNLAKMWQGQMSAALWIETIEEIDDALGALPVSEETPVGWPRFLHSFEGPIVDQLPAARPGSDIFVAAPFFGASVAGLSRLANRFRDCAVRLFPAVHSDGGIDLPITELENLSFVATTARLSVPTKQNAFPHLKLYGAADGASDGWLFCTSANCTVAGLEGPNIEAGLLRPLPSSTIGSYFAAADAEVPKKQVEIAHESATDNILAFSAVDNGSGLTITVVDRSRLHLPISGVTLRVTAGSDFSTATMPVLVGEQHGSVNLSWKAFAGWERPRKRAIRLEVSGTNPHGKCVRGACFVENQLLLRSDPIHRSAWRGALALLESEGAPELADVSAVFTLARGVFDGAFTTGSLKEPAKNESEHRKPEEGLAVAIWPPKPDAHDLHKRIGKTAAGQLQWFQHIMRTLLRSEERAETRSRVEDESDFDERNPNVADDARRLKEQERAATLAEQIWMRAKGHAEELLSKLQELVPMPHNAPNIWPAAIFTFLATMAVLRTAIRISPKVEWETSGSELLDDFLRVMFTQRRQTENFCAPTSYPQSYKREKFPALADDLRQRFLQQLSPDLANVMLALLADKKMRTGKGLYPLMWPERVKQICGGTFPSDEASRGECRLIWKRFVRSAAADDTTDEFDRAIDELCAVAGGSR